MQVKSCFLVIALWILTFSCLSQPLVRKALFIGNSYTYVNELPALTAALAYSAGDSLFFDSSAPGGYTLGWQPIAHCTNTLTLQKIRETNWDFVVLQEQSQIPAIPALRDSCMYPASEILHDSVGSANSCGRVLFYLTWGRRFGGIQCFTSNYCSTDFSGFDQMQDSLTTAYKRIADSLDDWIAPVGEAWRFALQNSAMVLHAGDNSHPNLNGSYLAACVFYSCIFGKSPVGLPFTAGLVPDSALFLQHVADTVVFTDPSFWNLWSDQPEPAFETIIGGDTMQTENLSTNASMWLWDFGDGNTSEAFEPIHVYASPGTYTVQLTACDSCRCDSLAQDISILLSGTTDHRGEERIVLAGPDVSGTVKTIHYEGDGTLILYDISGRLVLQTRIHAGRVQTGHLSSGYYLWYLSPPKGPPVQGKFLIYQNH